MEKREVLRLLWRRTVVTVLITVILYTGYQLSNRFHWMTPAYLPMSELDQQIPFWLWTVWPYNVLVVLTLLPIGIRDEHLFRHTMLAIIIAVCLNIVVWMLYPTAYPRPALPAGEDNLTRQAFLWLWTIDTPANCFPSGHITSPTISVWALAQENPRWRWTIRILFGLLSLTILTTKQHYIVDLFGGFASAWIGIQLGRRWKRQYS